MVGIFEHARPENAEGSEGIHSIGKICFWGIQNTYSHADVATPVMQTARTGPCDTVTGCTPSSKNFLDKNSLDKAMPTCASKNGGSKLLVRRETTRKVENALF